jgi:hypothetical protein
MTQLIDQTYSLSENTDGHIIERVQQIPDGFMEALKQERIASSSVREGEMMRVASIPTALVDAWIAQGFPFYEMTVKQIVAKLKADNLEYFMTTDKSI